MKHYFLYLLIILFAVGCRSNHIRLLKSGKVVEKDYLIEIPANYEKGLLFITVSMEGKDYNFVYDTGANATVIDERIIPFFKHKKKYERFVNDSSKRKRKLEYIEVPSIKIGEIDFQKTGAIIGDLSVINDVLGCSQVDGILGSNLMRKAVWQIDYEQELIRFSDKTHTLKPVSTAYQFPMKAGEIGSAKLRVKIDGVASNFKFDTGFAGFIKGTQKVLTAIKSINEAFEMVTLEGITGAGLFGRNKGFKRYGYAQNCEMGALKMEGKVIEFRDKGNQLAGNYLFENFLITTDWNKGIIYFDPTKSIKRDTLKDYPIKFAADYNKQEIFVSSKWTHLKVGADVNIETKILQINGQSVTNFDKQKLCEFMVNPAWRTKELDVLFLYGAEEKRLNIEGIQLLPKKIN